MSEMLLQVRDLVKRYSQRDGDDVVAVDGVSFFVGESECVGVVGESGCGKSTIARMVCGLERPTSGHVVVCGQDLGDVRGSVPRVVGRSVQMVFQNPRSSFDPRRRLVHGVCEPLRCAGVGAAKARARAAELFEACGLSSELLDKYPREVSGGQCQRAAIARALAPNPRLIVCDEPTSALDVTVQARLIDLLGGLREDLGLSLLFISHDLALVQGFCDRVLVMREGRVVEEGPTNEVLFRPRHPYTRELLRLAGE